MIKVKKQDMTKKRIDYNFKNKLATFRALFLSFLSVDKKNVDGIHILCNRWTFKPCSSNQEINIIRVILRSSIKI